MKFIVNKELFNNYNNLSVGVIVCNNIDNTKNVDLANEIKKVNVDVISKFSNIDPLSEYPIIREWRNIYKSFGEKKSRSSIEALIRRTLNGNDIPVINPLVDIYNMISLKYELPCGGEDIDKITSDIELTYAVGVEEFIPLGETTLEIVNESEIVYKSGNTVLCRNFNYRESDITKLSSNTKNCILVIESVLESNKLESALDELSNLVSTLLGATTKKYVLNKDNSEIEL